MDKTKKIIFRVLMLVGLLSSTSLLNAQSVSEIQFCDRKYEYEIGKDSITLYFNMLDKYGNRIQELSAEQLDNYLVIKEDGELIPLDRSEVSLVNSGQRIPSEYTFSVLVDLSIPQNGKEQIYNTVARLVESAPDGCVYLSFFGDNVTSSNVITRDNYKQQRDKFFVKSENKYFYSGLYSKLLEFSDAITEKDSLIIAENDYARNEIISSRAMQNTDKNILFVFTEGSKRPSDEELGFIDVVGYQEDVTRVVPKVIALYYTEDNEGTRIENTLKGICAPKDSAGVTISEREGRYLPSNDMAEVLKNFEEVVNDAMYDYSFKYKVDESQNYARIVKFSGEWKAADIGSGEFSIGTAERSWPIRAEKTSDMVYKYLYALLITLGAISFFFVVAKICVPYIRSKSFAVKYYKRYEAEENISRRICHYCKQDIQPGQMVVTKCKHIMHVHCWQQNGYKCAEYGQNCKTGIQSHIEWKELFTLNSLKDCYQTISGIVAGFISWIMYEFFGRGCFEHISKKLVDIFYTEPTDMATLYVDCVNKTSAFLTIGLLLGFFLSVIFRYNDEYKKKDLMVWGKIIGLSLLTAIIGMIAFAIGAILLCLILTAIKTTYIPWYCSLPAYMLFSICVSLALTIKSTIPIKSALIGGLCSALIGFIVLYYSSRTSSASGWMNMLLDFTIYGGGLGASLVTVRMLAEKYFLVIQNGVRAGQRIPIHKWMNATGGGNKVSIGMTGECEIQMNWEKSNKVAKEHVQLFIDYDKQLPMLKPLATGVIFNTRAELSVGKPCVLSNGDNFKIGDTIFLYQETE